MPLVEAFARIAELGGALGVRNVNELPGCWEHQIDEHWHLSLNGHKEAITDSKGREVPPFHASIDWNGWPAGLISPGGGIIAAGACANEDTFIEALKAATLKAGGAVEEMS